MTRPIPHCAVGMALLLFSIFTNTATAQALDNTGKTTQTDSKIPTSQKTTAAPDKKPLDKKPLNITFDPKWEKLHPQDYVWVSRRASLEFGPDFNFAHKDTLSMMLEECRGRIPIFERANINVEFREIIKMENNTMAGTLRIGTPPGADPDLLYQLLVTETNRELQSYFEEARRQQDEQWAHATSRLEMARVERQKAEEILARLLNDSKRSTITSQEELRDLIRSLNSQRMTLEMDLIGGRARRNALEERLAHELAKFKDQPADDVAEMLINVVKLREQDLARTRQLIQSGTAQLSVLQNREVELATARAELARHQLKNRKSVMELAPTVNEEIQQLSARLAENEARFGYLDKQLSQLTNGETQKHLYNLENVRQSIQVAREVERIADIHYQQLRQKRATTIAPRLRMAKP